MDFPPPTDGNIQPGVDAGGNGNPAATGFACLCRVGEVSSWAAVPVVLLVALALLSFWARRKRNTTGNGEQGTGNREVRR
jgi:hypothetical protein